jgi:hypothetical protein
MTRIDVVDNHGQFTHLEHRALRDMGVDVETIDNDTPPAEIDADGLVLSGGPDIDRIGNCPAYLDLEIPVFGICLGMQIIAAELDGRSAPASTAATPTSPSKSPTRRTRSWGRWPPKRECGPATPTRSRKSPRASSAPRKATSAASRP